MYTHLARDMAEPSILVTLRAAATEGATRIVAILYLHSLGIHFRREIVGDPRLPPAWIGRDSEFGWHQIGHAARDGRG